MTDNNHPITPPPELVQQWLNAPRYAKSPKDGTFVVQKCHSLSESEVIALVENAARWGADQELDACCKDIIEIIAGVFADRVIYDWDQFVELLRDGRRPQPLSLKEQAFDALHGIHDQGPTPEQVAIIRRALESLPD